MSFSAFRCGKSPLPIFIFPRRRPRSVRSVYDGMSLRAVHSMTRLWADVRPELGLVRQPLLLFRSASDGDDGELSTRVVLAGVGSTGKHEVSLENNNHLATLDNDAQLIFERSAALLADYT